MDAPARSDTGTSEPTATKLVEAAAHLFARHGIETVPLRDIGAMAGQRNASAVQYHFGGRWDLVVGILARHSSTVNGWDPGDAPNHKAVVEGLVALLSPELETNAGRDFLRVIAELMMRYPGRWDSDPGVNAGMRSMVKRVIALSRPLPGEVARARAVAMTQFITYQMAERARLIDEDVPIPLDDTTFLINLTEMSTAMLAAPSPVRPQRRRNQRVQQ